jgi:hypothetical protein
MTRLTVFFETPASRATSLIVGVLLELDIVGFERLSLCSPPSRGQLRECKNWSC